MNNRFDRLADKLFFEFENNQNKKHNNSYLSFNTETLLSFEKYIETIPIYKIQTLDPSFSEKDLSYFKQFVQRGIEKYLFDHIKTIAIM